MMKKSILCIALCLLLALGALPSIAEERPDFAGLKYESSMNLIYATGFSVDYYEGGYALIDVKDSAQYLVVPEGMPVP